MATSRRAFGFEVVPMVSFSQLTGCSSVQHQLSREHDATFVKLFRLIQALGEKLFGSLTSLEQHKNHSRKIQRGAATMVDSLGGKFPRRQDAKNRSSSTLFVPIRLSNKIKLVP
jgi:hypothetical protein